MAKTCEGEAPSEILFRYLVEAIQERNALDDKIEGPALSDRKPKRKHAIAHAVAESQIAVLSYSVALIRNPYLLEMEKVLAEAEDAASE